MLMTFATRLLLLLEVGWRARSAQGRLPSRVQEAGNEPLIHFETIASVFVSVPPLVSAFLR